jgi:hypothetical protein
LEGWSANSKLVETSDDDGACVMTEEKRKGSVEGTVGGKAEEKSEKKPGALVEDETLAGTVEGGVVPKDPSGQAVEGEATDPRENPSD